MHAWSVLRYIPDRVAGTYLIWFYSILFWICKFICWQVLDGDASLVAIVFDTSTVEPLFSACGYAMSYLAYAF